MSAYISQSDIEKRIDRVKLIQLTDDSRSGNVDAGVVTEIIAEAEGTFDSYARARYALPVPVTQKVKSVCLDVAVYMLFQRRATTKDGIFEVKKQAYDNAVKFLEALASGKAALDVPAAEETATQPAAGDKVLSGPAKEATFSDRKLSGY